MDTHLFRFIWHYSRRQQIQLLLLTLLAFPLLYLSLEIPKVIINEALAASSEARDLLSYSLEPLPFLMILSFTLLGLVLLSGLLKMHINTYKGLVGEGLIRRLRYMLVERLLQFPSQHFEHVSQGEVIATVVSETEPLAGFSGESVALPLFQGGTLITILAFMFAQDWLLGLAAITLVPLQLYIIPRLQRKINALRKQRVARVRAISQRLGETVSAASEIRIQGTQRYTLAEFSYRLGEIYQIRLEIFQRKFFMKFLNNTLGQLTPFMFYAIGGYLILEGRLTVGALVAAIAAHKDFLNPWKELLNYYQAYQDNVTKYQQIIENFNPYKYPHEAYQLIKPTAVATCFTQPLTLSGVAIHSATGEPLVNDIDLQVQPGQNIAILCTDIRIRPLFAKVLAGLDLPGYGEVRLGDIPLTHLPEHQLRLNMGYVSQPYLFNASISYNLIYGLNHVPPVLTSTAQKKLLKQSQQAGNSGDWFDEDFSTTWTDFQQLNLPYKDWDSISRELQHLLDNVLGNGSAVYDLSLRESFDPKDFPPHVFDQLCRNIVALRQLMSDFINQDEEHANLVEQFHPDKLNRYATLSENLLFGTFTNNHETHKKHLLCLVMKQLQAHHLLEQSFDLAKAYLQRLLDQQPYLTKLHPIRTRFSLYDQEKLTAYQHLLQQVTGTPQTLHKQSIQLELMEVFMRIIPNDWPDLVITERYCRALIVVREELQPHLQQEFQAFYHRFDPDIYNPGLVVWNNILFGRINRSHPGAEATVRAEMEHHIEQTEGMRSALQRLFLINTQAGVGGVRLPEVVHHRIGLMRALIKRPKILILSGALSALALEEKNRVYNNIRRYRPDMTLIWITGETDMSSDFDQVYELSSEGLLPLQQAYTTDHGNQRAA